MTPERYEKAGRIYDAALEIKPESRKAFLEMECGVDEGLRREVESLLAAHNNVGDYFDAPALEVAAGLVAKQKNLSLMGESFSHYRVLSLIGSGGMGEVYLAEDTRLGRKVALKMLPREFTRDQERVRRFEQEARAASALNHPNIVTIYEVGQVEGRHFIAIEYIEGETLRGRFSSGRIELREAVEIGAQMASALQAAHEAGIVHRDIKPENIMVRRDGLVKVLDFGLAKLGERQSRSEGPEETTEVVVTSTPGVVLGTLNYMSPEQARGERLDKRTDIFSLGMVLYEMVAGKSPFAASSSAETLAAILEWEPSPLAQYAQNAPVEMERIVGKALRKKRDERYQTAGDLAIDLKGLKQEIEVEATLKRAARPDSESRGVRTASGGLAAVATVEKAIVRTDDLATAKTISSTEALENEVKRRKLWAALAAAVLIAVAALTYSFYPTSSGDAIDSVAVLPFVNASGDPNTEYLSDGMSDSIINSLSRLPSLKVISLNTVLRYKGKQVDPQAVGRELNVRAVLMGRMTQRGDDLAISTELVDVRDNRRLWGEQYNRRLSDILAIEEEVAREIAENLRLRLDSTEKQRLTKQYTESTEAHQAYLRGRYKLDRRIGVEKSIEYFEQAIKLDPNYALAYADLAYAYWSLDTLGGLSHKELAPKAKEAVAKALAIDDTVAHAHLALGYIRLTDWDWPGAERAFKRAIGLNPNSGYVYEGYTYYLRTMSRFDEAIAESKRAVELEPVSVLFNRNVGINLYLARRYDEAIEQFQKTLELDSNMPSVYRWLAKAYEQKKLYDQAVAAYAKTEEFSRYGPEAGAALKEVYAASGWKGFLRRALNLKEEWEKERIGAYRHAEIYARLGVKDQAFAWLEKVYEEHEMFLTIVNVDPAFDDLRTDKRYVELLRRMNLEP